MMTGGMPTPAGPSGLDPGLEAAGGAAPTLTTGVRRGGGGRRAAGESRARWRPDSQLYLTICRIIDTVAAPALLVVMFLLSNFAATMAGLHDFLGLRITIKNLLYVVAFAIAWRAICSLWKLYDWGVVHDLRAECLRLIGACSTAAALALVFPAISVTGAFSLDVVVGFWAASVGLLPLTRVVLRRLALWTDGEPHEVLIVGTGPRAMEAFHALNEESKGNSRVVGFVDSRVWSPVGVPEGALLGNLQDLEGLLMRNAVDEVLIALPIKSCYEDVQSALVICERVGVRATYLADVFQYTQAKPRLEGHDELPVMAMLMAPDDHRLITKRAIDLAGAVTGLVLLSPLLLLTALAVKLTSPGPVLFVQPRYGLNRRRFRMLKFRTMIDGAERLQSSLEHLNENNGPTFKIKEDPRMTTVGRWLRRSSIDELPQLLNVCWGDMSLVGPRPLPERDVHRFSDATLMRRFSVRPGITCLWQINGRSDVEDFDTWVAMDLNYIDRWSLGLDVSILMRTIPVVLRGRGAA